MSAEKKIAACCIGCIPGVLSLLSRAQKSPLSRSAVAPSAGATVGQRTGNSCFSHAAAASGTCQVRSNLLLWSGPLSSAQ